MSSDQQGDDYIKSCRTGDEEAARKLFHEHVDQLLELARQRLSQRLAGRVDAEDVVQSVFRTFFKRARAGEFVLHDEEDLCKLLVRITLYKTLRQVAFHRQAKRDARQEAPGGDAGQEQLLQAMSSGPTPEEAVIFLDELEFFLNQMPDEDKTICRMRLEGHTNVEIARELGISERRIRRLLERLRGLAKRENWLEEE
jgi:RNA polymerase sigma-70 factor (ECF subfamily)